MRFAVVGAGAIGSYAGALLAAAGEDVTLIAHGEHNVAAARNGVRVTSALGDVLAHPAATSNLAAVAESDVVLLALKAHHISGVAPALGKLIGRDTVLVAMQNGIPWWYFQRHGGPLEGTALQSVDPAGTVAASIPIASVVGCVIYASVDRVAPGVVHHTGGTRFIFGEPDGSDSPRTRTIAQAFERAGLTAPVVPVIRREIWTKLLGNAAFNPISALTGATLDVMCDDAFVRPVVYDAMSETVAVANALEIAFDLSIDQRIARARTIGAHKTSMLQDLEAGRPLELAPLTGAVVELGMLTGVATPVSQRIYALARLLDASAPRRPPR